MTLLAQGVSPRRVARLVCGSDTVCPLCRKTFSYPESMIRHCQGHLPTAHRLRCSACGKTFHRRDQFKYHQARCEARHTHLQPGPLLPPPSLWSISQFPYHSLIPIIAFGLIKQKMSTTVYLLLTKASCSFIKHFIYVSLSFFTKSKCFKNLSYIKHLLFFF